MQNHMKTMRKRMKMMLEIHKSKKTNWPGVPKRAQSFGSIYNSWMETEENKSIYLRHSVCSNWHSRNEKFSMGYVEKQNTVFQKHSHLIKCLWPLHYSWCDVAVLQSTLIKPKMWTPVKALTLHHRAAMDICVQVFIWRYIFNSLGYIYLGMRIVEACDNYV